MENVSFFIPQLTLGGVSSVTKKIAKGIIPNVKNVYILTLKKPSYESLYSVPEGIRVITLSNFFSFCKVLKKSKMVFPPSYHSVILSLMIYMFFGKKSVFIFDRCISSLINGGLYSKLYYFSMKLLVPISCRIVFTYKLAFEEFKNQYSSHKHKAVLIYYPVDENFFSANSNTGVNKNIDILYAGRLEEEKGVIYLIKAIEIIQKKNSDIKLTILGSGSQSVFLQDYCKINHINNVDFIGEVNNVHDYMLRSKVFVLPSISEGCASVIKECIVSNLPVVVTSVDTGGPQEAIGHGEFGEISEIKCPQSLAVNIEIALNKRYNQDFRSSVMVTSRVEYAGQKYIELLRL
ncbi:glycosyltransferase [Vibrio gigantis]|uniref:Glycosyltransferase n=1 Tax=Vibrio gigantis TaxID=296199 RepID=A0A5M9NKP8_9VIBR|nr:glycosyltransferase [Vibrio gigantis]KAA8671171.1 glycosyltransferase [Vibrio gigantis]